MSISEYKNIEKNELKKISIEYFSDNLPDLKNCINIKSIEIANWMEQMISKGIKNKNFAVNYLMPQKTELAYLLGVSVGTIQNVFRLLEDKGYLQSKQCIGTMIADWDNPIKSMRKFTSKRDLAVFNLKNFIKMNSFNIGSRLPSTRVLASVIETSLSTTRFALENLCVEGILSHDATKDNETGWIVEINNFLIEKNNFQETLVEKVTIDLKKYINENLHIGSSMPAHRTMASILNVSSKTVHDALKVLISDGYLLARRGKYGTSVLRMPNDKKIQQTDEISIFASAQETAFYHYEKVQNHIRNMIADNYEIGEKLPSIIEMSKTFDLNPNTIRKSFNNLAKEGILRFSRGRYGGAYVIDIPENTMTPTYKWLAVNPKYAKTTINN